MSLRYYLLIFTITWIVAGAIWTWLIFNKDPVYASNIEIIGFYSSLFISQTSFLTLIIFYYRLFRTNNAYFYGNFIRSFRQSALISLYTICCLFILSLRIGRWYDFILLGLAIFLFELYFKSRDSARTIITEQKQLNTEQNNNEENQDNLTPPPLKHINS